MDVNYSSRRELSSLSIFYLSRKTTFHQVVANFPLPTLIIINGVCDRVISGFVKKFHPNRNNQYQIYINIRYCGNTIRMNVWLIMDSPIKKNKENY